MSARRKIGSSIEPFVRRGNSRGKLVKVMEEVKVMEVVKVMEEVKEM